MPLNLEVKRKKTPISLTPLIDVVFILLLFFMLTSTFTKWRKVDTPLPMTEVNPPAEVNDLTKHRFVLKANDGMVWIDEQPVSIEDGEYIRNLIQSDPTALFLVDAETGVTLQSLMTLADQLKLQGVEKVSIANVFNEQK